MENNGAELSISLGLGSFWRSRSSHIRTMDRDPTGKSGKESHHRLPELEPSQGRFTSGRSAVDLGGQLVTGTSVLWQSYGLLYDRKNSELGLGVLSFRKRLRKRLIIPLPSKARIDLKLSDPPKDLPVPSPDRTRTNTPCIPVSSPIYSPHPRDMAQLSKEDNRIVRKWWKCSSGLIFENGRFILDNEYRPSASTNCCKLVGNGRSFQSILRSAGVGNIVRRSPFS